MYPNKELIRLAAYKAAMSRDIALRRSQCVRVATRAAQPLDWLDRVLGFWRRLSPVAQFAAVPMAILIQRTVFPHRKLLGSLLC